MRRRWRTGGGATTTATAPLCMRCAASPSRRSPRPSCTHHIYTYASSVGPYLLHGQTRALERKRPEGNLHITRRRTTRRRRSAIQPQTKPEFDQMVGSSSTRSILPLWNAGISISFFFCPSNALFTTFKKKKKRPPGNPAFLRALTYHLKNNASFSSSN